MRMMIFLAELNGMEMIAADIDYGHEGHLILIGEALYGMKTSGARFHENIAKTIYQLGFMPSKADSDVWMKDCKDHWEYICTW
eukprot:1032704-Ditylum_brightwellii.AAC.1